jgi:protein-tyrosine phosphatase
VSEVLELVDIHNHLIPGVDDGARELGDSLDALAAMHAQGVRRIVATPHIDASLIARGALFAERMDHVDAAWERLRSAAASSFPDVRLERGHEVMLDMPHVPLTDPRVRLGGGCAVLVEFPRRFMPIGSTAVLEGIRRDGFVPVVAHPERYLDGGSDPFALVGEWRRVGAAMAVNAGSLLGGYGEGPRAAARELLRRGWADLIGSDYHTRSNRRPLLLRDAVEAMRLAGGSEQAELLTRANPARLLDGEPPVPVAPLALRDSVWDRIRLLLRGP